MVDNNRLEVLFQRYLNHSETSEELNELMEFIACVDNKERVEQLMDVATLDMISRERLSEEQTEKIFNTIKLQTRDSK